MNVKVIVLFAIGLICFVSEAQTKFLTSFDGTRIAYYDEGEGLPVLLIHGFINSKNSWDNTELKKGLINNGFRVIVPDLRGNGESDKPHEDSAFANDVEITDLILLMDSLGINNYDALGYSRGSIVLAKLLTKDKRINKAVLGGMGLDFTDPDWDRRIMFSEAFDGKITAETEGAVKYASSIGADLRCLHLQQKYQPVTSLDELSKIKTKVLIISGDNDTDNGNPKDLQNAIPGSILKIVNGDHNGTYKTEAFSKAIMSFLE